MIELIAAILGYLLGSIPFGLLLAKLAGHGDIRNIGSGNIGATNVLRTGNKKLAILTLLLDGSKGAFAIFITGTFVNQESALIAGIFAIIGHCYPVWLKFKGGKGVATALGVFLAAVPFAGAIACATWLTTALISKTSSLSALIAVLTVPLVTFFVYGPAPATIALLITALIWWRHKDNIKRLIKGEEPKIGKRT